MSVFHMIVVWLRGLVRDQADLATENLALRQQLAVLTERKRRPRLSWCDRVLWATPPTQSTTTTVGWTDSHSTRSIPSSRVVSTTHCYPRKPH
jgi:hypothetical protein